MSARNGEQRTTSNGTAEQEHEHEQEGNGYLRTFCFVYSIRPPASTMAWSSGEKGLKR